MDEQTLDAWERRVADHVRRNGAGDTAHDVAHVERVVKNARQLARQEGAALAVVVPAAWLHDIVAVPKDSPNRAKASQMAAAEAARILRGLGYSEDLVPPIVHAIEAHSFSANIEPLTVEAKVVQDADRLEALGAIGIARCFATSGAMGRSLYNTADPFAEARPLDDCAFALDHFAAKLFRLADKMQTAAGRAEAQRRTEFLRAYVDQFRGEIGA